MYAKILNNPSQNDLDKAMKEIKEENGIYQDSKLTSVAYTESSEARYDCPGMVNRLVNTTLVIFYSK